MDTLVPTIQPSEAPPAEKVPDATPSEDLTPRSRLTLRDAVRLCGMSEKTLRRKLEAGLLQGYRENLDYGGFMWMIEAQSLAELYPDSAQLRDYISLLEAQLNDPAPSPPPSPRPVEEEEDEPAPAETRSSSGGPHRDFVMFLIEENRNLKDDLRDRDIQLRNLQDRSLRLERECGEQRGTAATQARVLEWFQKQPNSAPPAQAALPPAPGTATAPTTTPRITSRQWLLGAFGGVAVSFLLLFIVQHLFRH